LSKPQRAYVCGDCGADTLKWQGQCPVCNAWNSLKSITIAGGKADGGKAGGARKDRNNWSGDVRSQRLADVGSERITRRSTGIAELDRVLGGGLVPGSVTLIGGDPGIGKSTLLLQACVNAPPNEAVLYVSGEESLQQIAMRAQRLGLDPEGITVLAATDIDDIVGLAEKEKPATLIIDSVQTVYSADLPSAPGSVNQLRECTARLVRMAKTVNVPVLLVGHVTKEGSIAGPRVLEHMVDTVLYFENEASSRYRVLRTVKNRFGAANELGIFAMTEAGMREVKNPSAIFLTSRDEPIVGSVVTAVHQGSRPLLVEVQVLTDRSGGGPPRRVTVGVEQNRLSLLLAALHRYGGIRAHDEDVFLNVVGGVKIAETSADLAILVAAASSINDMPVPRHVIIFGEVGLAGEIRPVPFGEERLTEAAKLGFTYAIAPKANIPRKPVAGLTTMGVTTLQEALQALSKIAP